MKLKGRTILVIALLFFGGYAVFDFYNEKRTDLKTAEESRLLTVNYEQIDTIQLQQGAIKILLKKSPEGWDLLEPIKDQADNSFVEDFINNLVPEKIIEEAIEGEAIDWSRYGLKEPAAELIVRTNLGTENRFEISEKKNFEDNLFLRKDHQAKVLVVGYNWLNRAHLTVNEFRDRHWLRKKIASVDSLVLKNGKGIIELKRVDGKWEVGGKKEIKLDQNKVRELLTTIADAKGADMLANAPSGNAGKVIFSLQLLMPELKWTADVFQGKDLAIYARVSEPAYIYKMESGAVDNLIKMNLDDLKEQVMQSQKAPNVK